MRTTRRRTYRPDPIQPEFRWTPTAAGWAEIQQLLRDYVATAHEALTAMGRYLAEQRAAAGTRSTRPEE